MSFNLDSNWAIFLATVIGIGLQIYFNRRALKLTTQALETSNLQHKQNLDYQEKIALFEKRSKLLEEMATMKFFVEMHTLLKENHLITFKKRSYYFYNSATSHSISMVEFIKDYDAKESPIPNYDVIKQFCDTSQLMLNKLDLLFKPNISKNFKDEIHNHLQDVRKCIENICHMKEVKKNAEKIIEIAKIFSDNFYDSMANLTLEVSEETKLWKE